MLYSVDTDVHGCQQISVNCLQFIAQSAVSYIVHVRVKSCDPFTRIARNSVKNWAQNKNSHASLPRLLFFRVGPARLSIGEVSNINSY